MATTKQYDVAVIGAGVFGAWTAYQLAGRKASVVLIDAFGPGNSRSSSGGETRIIRTGYGPDEIYSQLAKRSLTFWLDLFGSARDRFFVNTGVLWLASEPENYCKAMTEVFGRLQIEFEYFDTSQLRSRYPYLSFETVQFGILESGAGILMARNAVKNVVARAQTLGVDYITAAVPSFSFTAPPETLTTLSGETIRAKLFVFACGPWLPKLFPSVLKEKIHVTRQEVYFFGVPPGDSNFDPAHMPAWIDFNELVYALPNVDGRGLKFAVDAHGAEFDPDSSDRIASSEGLAVARERLARLIPSMSDAPVVESRVCQYENTSNGDFLIDRHPEFENVYLVGGGSGHGFKHGPAVGEYVADMIGGSRPPEPRFLLNSKRDVHARQVF